MKKVCVIGWPIDHSKSPLIHNYWLEKYQINGLYEKRTVAPNALEKFLAEIEQEGFVGCNITIPHKERAFQSDLEITDEITRKIRAVNTVYINQSIKYGLNTDAYGFISNLKSTLPNWSMENQIALVVGAGGASRAILVGLIAEGAKQIFVANRTFSRAKQLSDELDPVITAIDFSEIPTLLPKTDLLVNTTSLGMVGQPKLDLDITPLPPHAVVTDIVYTPLETPLLKAARNAGLQTVDGLGMLLHQAVPGFEKWFGKRPEVTDELRKLAIEAL